MWKLQFLLKPSSHEGLLWGLRDNRCELRRTSLDLRGSGSFSWQARVGPPLVWASWQDLRFTCCHIYVLHFSNAENCVWTFSPLAQPFLCPTHHSSADGMSLQYLWTLRIYVYSLFLLLEWKLPEGRTRCGWALVHGSKQCYLLSKIWAQKCANEWSHNTIWCVKTW